MIRILGAATAFLSIAVIIAGMQIRYLKQQVETLEKNEEKLEQAIVEQKTTLKTQTALTEASVAREVDLERDLDASEQVATGFSNESNQLRASEHEKALREPYARGVASARRLGSLWMRIEGETYNDNLASRITETDDPPSPDG